MLVADRRSATGAKENIPLQRVATGVEFGRATPVAWQQELDAICPPSPNLPQFYLRWEAGEAWQPLGRWVIWNLQPRRITHDPNRSAWYDAIIAECEGPHPRSTGHHCAPNQCACEIKTGAWRDGATSLIDRDTWEVYRETGRYGRRWWVIQGAAGGHRYRLAPWERRIWHTVTGQQDVPSIGDLPYAPWDNRVKRHLLGLEQTMRWLSVVKYGEKNRHQLDTEERQEVDLAKAAVANWMAGQMDEVWDEYGTLLRRQAQSVGSGAYRADPHFNPDEVAESYRLS